MSNCPKSVNPGKILNVFYSNNSRSYNSILFWQTQLISMSNHLAIGGLHRMMQWAGTRLVLLYWWSLTRGKDWHGRPSISVATNLIKDRSPANDLLFLSRFRSGFAYALSIYHTSIHTPQNTHTFANVFFLVRFQTARTHRPSALANSLERTFITHNFVVPYIRCPNHRTYYPISDSKPDLSELPMFFWDTKPKRDYPIREQHGAYTAFIYF